METRYVWSSPAGSEFVAHDVMHLAAGVQQARRGDQPIALVNFLANWDGTWQVVCRVTAPAGGDLYACDWNLARAGVWAGPLQVSFDVYDAGGNWRHSPAGRNA